jgi:hypothetical protein
MGTKSDALRKFNVQRGQAFITLINPEIRSSQGEKSVIKGGEIILPYGKARSAEMKKL